MLSWEKRKERGEKIPTRFLRRNLDGAVDMSVNKIDDCS